MHNRLLGVLATSRSSALDPITPNPSFYYADGFSRVDGQVTITPAGPQFY